MVKNHMKRLSAPKSWTLLRKHRVFVTRPKPGRAFKESMPLSHIMKVLLEKARTTKEVRYILHHTTVLVNGTRVYDHRRSVGLFDVITFTDINESYLMTLSPKGKIVPIKQSDKEAGTRLVTVKGKTRTAGKLQLNFSDGTNQLVTKDEYKTGDALVMNAGKIQKHLALKEGAAILLTGGSHLGEIGVVKNIDGRVITFDNDGHEESTAKRYAYVVGQGTPEVTIR